MIKAQGLPTTGKCRVRYGRLSPCGGERPTFSGWPGSTTRNAFRPRGKARSHASEDAFPDQPASSKDQFFALRRFVLLLGQLAIGFHHHLKGILQIFARLFQRFALGVDPRNLLDGGGPPVTHFLERSGQLHVLTVAAILALVQTTLAGQIVQKPLDEFVIYHLPVACDSGTTTVLFPSEISGLYAKSVAVQEQENVDFLISFTPGNPYFTIRALRKDAEDHLTVIYRRKAYVLRLSASDKPFYTVTFFEGERGGKRTPNSVVPERLLSLMDKVKAYPLFAEHQPDAVAGVLHAEPGAINYYEDFNVHIRDVWRFEAEDTVVFRVELENTSDATIYYKPQDLAVRLDERIYTQSIADASGVMPPKSMTPAFFAITGDGDGGRNHLAPDNPWNVLVVRADYLSTPTDSATPELK
jgi:hypothetical protein